jgi:hypothetical protein
LPRWLQRGRDCGVVFSLLVQRKPPLVRLEGGGGRAPQAGRAPRIPACSDDIREKVEHDSDACSVVEVKCKAKAFGEAHHSLVETPFA